MKYIIVSFLLFVGSQAAFAEWVQFSGNAQQESYIERNRIRKDGDSVRLWVLSSFSTPRIQDEGTSQSMVNLIEIQCKDETAQILSTIEYAEKMAQGAIIYSSERRISPRRIAPGTIMERLYSGFCLGKVN